MDIREQITSGKASIGIEFGSTRIKAVIIDDAAKVIASGSYAWENDYVNGLFTYPSQPKLSEL